MESPKWKVVERDFLGNTEYCVEIDLGDDGIKRFEKEPGFAWSTWAKSFAQAACNRLNSEISADPEDIKLADAIAKDKLAGQLKSDPHFYISRLVKEFDVNVVCLSQGHRNSLREVGSDHSAKAIDTCSRCGHKKMHYPYPPHFTGPSCTKEQADATETT